LKIESDNKTWDKRLIVRLLQTIGSPFEQNKRTLPRDNGRVQSGED
jgi:hypothetical protein